MYCFYLYPMNQSASIQGLIENPGLVYIAEDIFLYLDCKTLANCELVSK